MESVGATGVKIVAAKTANIGDNRTDWRMLEMGSNEVFNGVCWRWGPMKCSMEYQQWHRKVLETQEVEDMK